MRIFLLFTFALVSVILLWLGWAIYGVRLAAAILGTSISAPTEAGSFGDAFGAFSALFSAFGFAGLLITLFFQQQQIRQTERDQYRQRFESTFFELLRFFREARAAVRYTRRESLDGSDGTPSVGYVNTETFVAEEAFKAAMADIRSGWRMRAPPTKRELVALYRKLFHSENESKLGPYYRLLYTILQRISADDYLTPEDKITYGNLVRSQLTSHEAAMAAINGLAPFAKDFSRLVTEFRLLKYIDSLPVRILLEPHYPEQAFASREDSAKRAKFEPFKFS